MYHTRFCGTHYEMGRRWGELLHRNGREILDQVLFPITEERLSFSQQCEAFYECWFPEVLEEIQGVAAGQKCDYERLQAVLLSMYCIMPEQHCTCIAFKSEGHIILARNSDFLTAAEKLNMNCVYRFSGSGYDFQGNTTAFVEMEDGVNEHGLAIGLTSVYPKEIRAGLNAGMLLRYGLEKCRTAAEFVQSLKKMPVASSQTFTVADKSGDIILIEAGPGYFEVQYPDAGKPFVSAVNMFQTEAMKQYNVATDNWQADERYAAVHNGFMQETVYDQDTARRILGGAYGFTCQYDRKTGKDTVWSVIYDLEQREIYRCEGNPGRKIYKKDERFDF